MWNSRLLIVVAVVASLVTALAVFFVASVDVLILCAHAWHYADLGLLAEARQALRDGIVSHVVEVVDGYLLAAVMLIFALGLYELFVKDLRAARENAGANKILLIESFDDLKSRLAKVILLILIVNLFQDALRVKLTSALDLVYQGASLSLIGLALYLSHKADGPH